VPVRPYRTSDTENNALGIRKYKGFGAGLCYEQRRLADQGCTECDINVGRTALQ
jgi:hypothetical protein